MTDKQLRTIFSFEQNDLYDAIFEIIDELKDIEVQVAASQSLPDSERAFVNGSVSALIKLRAHFDDIRDQCRSLA